MTLYFGLVGLWLAVTGVAALRDPFDRAGYVELLLAALAGGACLVSRWMDER